MLVQLDRMKKEYDGFSLELNMDISENQVTGLIGANGAGKSTTFKLMLGLIRPDEGNVEIGFMKKECVQENKMEYRKEYNKDVMRE